MEVLKGKLNGTLSYYHISVKDKIRNDPDRTNAGSALTYSLQDGTQLSKGFEADLIASPFPGMHMIVGYGYNDSKFTNADSSVANLRPVSAPFHTGNFWVSYTIVRGKAAGLGLGFGGNYQSEAYLVNNRVKAGNYYRKDPFTLTVPSYTKFDATLFYDQPKYRFGLKVNNLTDKEYWTSDAYAFREPTRQFIANVMFKF